MKSVHSIRTIFKLKDKISLAQEDTCLKLDGTKPYFYENPIFEN